MEYEVIWEISDIYIPFSMILWALIAGFVIGVGVFLPKIDRLIYHNKLTKEDISSVIRWLLAAVIFTSLFVIEYNHPSIPNYAKEYKDGNYEIVEDFVDEVNIMNNYCIYIDGERYYMGPFNMPFYSVKHIMPKKGEYVRITYVPFHSEEAENGPWKIVKIEVKND